MKLINLFISYCHKDEDYIDEFKTHMAPLEANRSVVAWHDRKIGAGEIFQKDIDKNLDRADIICLFISANFLSSTACQMEKEIALEMRESKGIAVVPIILSACGWKDDKSISPLLCLPTDGRELNKFNNRSDGWQSVYEGIKQLIHSSLRLSGAEQTPAFSQFLNSAEMLTKAHARKEKVFLNDIFVFPELEKYDELKEYEKKESAEKLLKKLTDFSSVLIAGENQSGKTTLCKMMYVQFRENNYFPVYLSDGANLYLGKLENKITKAFNEQYVDVNLEEVCSKRIIPIVDDFHLARHKDKLAQDLRSYTHKVIVVDDIFSLNIQDEATIQSYTHFKIKELNPSLRNKLIEKWTKLAEPERTHQNTNYKEIDRTTELVNHALGKVIGGGIMPAYPFFILSVISTSETFGSSLDQEISSQGYCYQALIFLYLRKQGVRNDDIDTYLNFLTEFAFSIYITKNNELSDDEFRSFMRNYLQKYNLPVREEILKKNLQEAQIIAWDSLGNCKFRYPYLYFFFVAKYLSEHIEENKALIDKVISNLQKDENSYIAIFISHHTKNPYILDEVTLNALSLFDDQAPATLNKVEMKFIDDQVEIIVKEVLPPISATPEIERSKRLIAQDTADSASESSAGESEENYGIEFAAEIRRSVKTVEVMGLIIKNRAGSLDKERLDSIFEEAVKVHLRILKYFFDLIENEDGEIVEYISNRLRTLIEDQDEQRTTTGKRPRKLSQDDLQRISKIIFWNMNYFFIYGLLTKIIHSVGSDKLTDVISRVCDKEGTPAAQLIKHGILMWYNKNLQIRNLVEINNDVTFSETSKKMLRMLVVNHCAMHQIDYKDKQKIEANLAIPIQKLLQQK